MDNRETAIQAAHTRIGVTLKVIQLEVMMAFISGSDVVVTLLTGYGKWHKSLIFCVLPRIFDEIKNYKGTSPGQNILIKVLKFRKSINQFVFHNETDTP